MTSLFTSTCSKLTFFNRRHLLKMSTKASHVVCAILKSRYNNLDLNSGKKALQPGRNGGYAISDWANRKITTCRLNIWPTDPACRFLFDTSILAHKLSSCVNLCHLWHTKATEVKNLFGKLWKIWRMTSSDKQLK